MNIVREILRSVHSRRSGGSSGAVDITEGSVSQDHQKPRDSVQVIMATATLTRSVKSLLSDVEGNFDVNCGEKREKISSLVIPCVLFLF